MKAIEGAIKWQFVAAKCICMVPSFAIELVSLNLFKSRYLGSKMKRGPSNHILRIFILHNDYCHLQTKKIEFSTYHFGFFYPLTHPRMNLKTSMLHFCSCSLDPVYGLEFVFLLNLWMYLVNLTESQAELPDFRVTRLYSY